MLATKSEGDNMRAIAIAAAFGLAGCAGVSSAQYDPVPRGTLTTAGPAYSLPKGVVPVKVFVDSNGIGVTIEPAEMIADGDVGLLVARLQPSVFNNEKMNITVDAVTGFLSTVSSESEAKILEIAQEAGKLAGRLSLQNAKAAFIESKVIVFDESFDPLDRMDVIRINDGIQLAMTRASYAFLQAGGRLGGQAVPRVTLAVDTSRALLPQDGRGGPELVEPLPLRNCNLGICARAMTSRTIRVLLEDRPFASKVVNVPSREIIAVPVSQTILANQKINITIKEGILASYDMERASELLGLIKIPGAIIGGFVAGIVQGIGDQQSIIDKRKELADSEVALAEAEKRRLEVTKVKLQNATAEGGGKIPNAYAAATLTVYPYSSALAEAIRQRILAPPLPKEPAKTGNADLIN